MGTARKKVDMKAARMGNLSRRDALKIGGLAFAGIAGSSLLSACASGQAGSAGSGASSQASASAIIGRDAFVGLDAKVELADGTQAIAINFDNGATTPALQSVMDEISAQMPYYGSIGRGKGQKQSHSTEVFNQGRSKILAFVNAPAERYTVFYVGNTTDGMNKLSSALIESEDDIVITTRMEHHANDIPWRKRAKVLYVDVDEKGRLKLDEFEHLLSNNKVKFVSVGAAANVTGYVNDVHAIAKMAHAHGAKIVVDGAQIAAHRAFSMAGATPEENIDFFVFSAHKMYAPFGGGAVVGLTEELNKHIPEFYGGGMVNVVLDDGETYLDAPDRYEAGSPNYFGAVALAKAIDTFNEVGFEAIAEHEQVLIRKTIDGLSAIPGIVLYGDSENISDRVGTVVFNVEGKDAATVAQELADKYAIAVRQGMFCAHPYCYRLLGLESDQVREDMDDADFQLPAMVRVSFGMYNTEEEVDVLIEAMKDIAGA